MTRSTAVNAVAIGITGWAFAKESFLPLAAALDPTLPLEIFTPAALINAGRAAEFPDPEQDFAEALSRRIAGSAPALVLIGWSMGALIALEAALLSPRRVAALVLISGTARFCRAPGYPSGMPAGLLEAMIARLAVQPAAVVADFISRVFPPDTVDDRERQALEAAALRQDPADLARGLRYLAATDLRDRLERIGCPVLIIHGARDRIVPPAASVRLHHGLAASRLETIDGAGHALPLCHAEDLGGRILAFLRGQPQA